MKISPILDHIDSGHMSIASQASVICFTSVKDCKHYVDQKILVGQVPT